MKKRNWFESLDPDTRIICDEQGAESCLPFIYLRHSEYGLEIKTWHSGYYGTAEMIETEEDLDSLIEALQKAKKVFHIQEVIDSSWEPRIDPFDCFKGDK